MGVLTDELVEYYKHKRPYIPYQERAEIVAALKYVDKVVPVDFSNTDKMDAWNLYHYDCHFSGSDHGEDWNEICERLRGRIEYGVFFRIQKAQVLLRLRP